ncbi:sensor histidine kinase [Paenibacillus whitsoniae]|uniref:histidine kinase n=1 Tax=Paenibacillus whitsoniae TaxID=2496558 RepID=A0A3S0CXX7_9BACL|nr:HAMP domain-containing sensor histidine kinase [Paenibacillus whitsoniae]RTE11314.1 sensor histidine kinase [Paenibacillus whitsoniae]
MKLRDYLLVASGVSTGMILLTLFICYRTMILNGRDVLILTTVTLGAAGVSMVLHYVMTRPLEKAIRAITRETEQLAEGQFEGKAPEIGPVEFQGLARQFNVMSVKLKESFQQLRSAEASRRELIANVSHDLRTPMASIQSYVEALQDEVIQDRPTFERYLQTIKLETGRLDALIQELFKLSQLEAGGTMYDPVPYYVDVLLIDSLQGLALKVEEKQLQVEVDVPDRLPPVAIMPQEINRVLGNMLSNAIRHSPLGGTIKIQAELADDGFVKLAIQDQGPGIPPEDVARVFERFYRVDPSRTRAGGGAGLGLAIAKSIVELHGGAVGVLSGQSVQGGRGCQSVQEEQGGQSVQEEQGDQSVQEEQGGQKANGAQSILSQHRTGSCFWFTLPVYRTE